MSRKFFLSRPLAMLILLCSWASASAQMSITGTTCAASGTQYQYAISGNWTNSTTMTWSIATGGGTINGSSSGTPLPRIYVTWSGTGTVSVVTSNPTGSASLNVTVFPTLTAGTIMINATQSINYNTIPGSIVCAGAAGGYCTPSYTYQWQSSTNNVSYSSISGATAQSLSFSSPLTQTMYYRDLVTETNSGSTVYSAVATVTVYPPLVSGSISPSTQTINYNTAPSELMASAPTGGSGINTYQWYDLPSGALAYDIIPGATSLHYSPGSLILPTTFMLESTSNGATVSTVATVNVNPSVSPGVVSPSTISILSGGSPGLLSSDQASGGACSGSYGYQWQSSTNGTTFSNISGATALTYSPGNLTVTTYFRMQVTCGAEVGYSNSSLVEVVSTSTDLNYIRVRGILKAGVTDSLTAASLTSPYDVAQVTQYMDGLGRFMQTVLMQETPLQKDLVTMNEYDNYGREASKYLPFGDTSSSGNYKYSAAADQNNFNTAQFPGEEYYYSLVSFEPSPLNRTSTTYPQGLNWVGSSRGVNVQYLVNQTSDSVRLWTIAYPIGSIPTSASMYPAGFLYKNITTDEAGHQVVEYKDMRERVVLKKVQLSATSGTAHQGWLCTYYVYDDLGYLRFVIPPQAVVLINANWTISSSISFELCFRYEYDQHGHMIVKKIPGAGEFWMVYDIRDRVVMTQDSNLRSIQKWLFTRYDVENRLDSTGFITDPTHYDSLSYQETTAFATNNYPVVSAYTNELLTQTYYDDYTWVSGSAPALGSTMATNNTSNSNWFITSFNVSPIYAVAMTPLYITRGLSTGSMKKVIGTTSQYLYAVSFYDDRGRVIQSQGINYTGAIDTATNQYDFTGKSLRNLISHKKNGNTVQSHEVVTKMDYDQGFRLRHIWKNIDNAASDQLIDSLQYNELGQLRAKYLGSNVDSLVYAYNVRGWLTGINPNYVAGTSTNYFGMELGYDKSTSVAPGNTYITPEYNGNIEGTVWKTGGTGINRKYDFSYDDVNRLAAANFNQYNGTGFDKSANIDFSVSNLSYDANGNILTMNQNGFLVGGSQSIDILSYSFLSGGSNKLMGVIDAANNPTSQLGDFHYNPATKQSTDYSYDGNGNLLSDNNKAIDSIRYNHLNLPDSVHMKGKGRIVYTYDAAGAKWKKTITDSLARHSTTILYLGGFVYQQNDSITNAGNGVDTLQFMAHEEGRARWAFQKSSTTGTTSYSFQYDFFEKDHLGNTRMVLTQERDTTKYLASMEYQYRTTESQLFGNIASTSAAWTSMPNESTNIPNNIRYAYTSPNDSVSKVDYSGTSGQTTGPSLLLKVMAGDTITPSVQCYYVSNTLTTTNSSLNSVLSSLASGILGTPTGAAEGNLSGYTSSSGPVFGALSSFLTTKDPGPPAGYPKAYLNWILLDDQFNYVSGSSGSVATASTTYPANQMNLVAPGGPIVMGRNGYLYVWVSNETQGWDVFFDDFAVQYKQGPLLEENHYYPYGLTMAGISDKALKTQYATNKYRYNGKELQNQEFSDGTGLEEYDYGARLQDPQLGVWHNIDPHAENSRKWSPYTYAYDNPIKYIDPDGMDNVVETAGGFNYTSSLAAWNDKREEDVKNVSGTIGGINAFIQQKAEDAAANALQQDPDDGSVENGDGGQSGPGDGGILKKALVTAAVVEVDGGGPLDVPADLIAGGIILGAYAHVLYNEAVTDDGAPDVNAPRAGKITDAPIYIPPQDQIDRELLNSPAKPGNAPTFKKDGTSVEIHHEGQSMEGPYKEMHWRDHRGKGNDKINHPDKGNPSKILRKLWDKQREEYWRQQNFPPENPVT